MLWCECPFTLFTHASCFRSDSDTSRRETTYLVFESALLALFTVCVFCYQRTSSIKKSLTGSFVRIVQTCKHCGKDRVWESQPYIRSTPLGNLLISAAILYTGSFPTKTLHFLQALKCATITQRTYFRHQSSFLHPTVNNIYELHEKQLIRKYKEAGQKLMLAGDGRADSPGHCAKFGSYTVIDLKTNRVVAFKLVQVNIVMYLMHLFIISTLSHAEQ